MKRTKTMLVLLILCIFFVPACAKQTTGTGSVPGNPYSGTPEADMVTVDLQTEPLALNTLITSDSVTTTIFQMSMTGLMKLNAEGQPVPGIAESVDVSEDKKTYTFHLRNDALWSNGDPVTAHDFLFAWSSILDPQTASPGAYLLCENIVNAQDIYDGTKTPDTLGVTATDDTTLSVELSDPIPYALELFAQSFFMPLNQKAYETIGAAAYGTDADKVVTNGAYLVAEWTHDSQITMTKNEAYYDAANIRIPRVKYVMLGDENARINAFKSGQLDMFNIFGQQIGLLAKDGDGIVNAYYDNSVFYFQFNKEREVTANTKICQALAMAIDTKSLCDDVFQDGSMPADGITPPGISGADGTSFSGARGSLFGYDAEKARQLFEEGLAELKMSAADLNLTYTSTNSSIEKMQAEYFQQQWQKNLGITVEIELMDWSALLQTQQNGDFDFTFSGWNGGLNDPLGYLNIFVSDNNNNVGRFKDEAYDTLITQAQHEADAAKRQEYMIEAEKILVDGGAVLPLYYTRIVYASSAKVKGTVCNSYQRYDFTSGAEIVK